jgi:hypothetical protein
MYITSQSAGIHVVLYRSTVLKIKYYNKNRSKTDYAARTTVNEAKKQNRK